MRDDFHFIHTINPDLVYHAELTSGKGSYKISWENKHGKDFTHYSVEDTEKAIDGGSWVIQII